MLMSYPHIRMLWIIIKLNSSEDKSICYRFKMGCHFICIIMEICAGKKFLAVGINTNNEEQYLFTTFPGNEKLIPARANDWLKWIYKKYPQKKITLHGFRHTHASLLFEAGATIKEVQTRLGHSSSKTTLDIYTHVTQSKKQEAAQKFANYIDF